MKKNGKIVAVAACLLCALLAYGAIQVCNKCGYEVPEGGDACTHCGATATPAGDPVEPASTPGSAGPDEPEQGSVTYLDPAVIADEVKHGRELMERGDYTTAKLFFRNAAALELLTDPGQKSNRADHILAYMKKCERGGGMVRADCPDCNGTGKKFLRSKTLTSKREQAVAAGSCDSCKGSGTVMKAGRIRDHKFKVAQAQRRYTDLQRSRKRVPLGSAWIPSRMEGSLGVRQGCMLKRATASPCQECLGLGREECKKCEGRGKLECKNSKCERGLVTVETGGKLTKSTTLTRREKCPDCKARGWLSCRDCSVRGSGRGNIPCEKCNGSGERAACSRCSGQGYANCRRCGAAGKLDGEDCATCAGEGIQACTTCNGDGKKR